MLTIVGDNINRKMCRPLMSMHRGTKHINWENKQTTTKRTQHRVDCVGAGGNASGQVPKAYVNLPGRILKEP